MIYLFQIRPWTAKQFQAIPRRSLFGFMQMTPILGKNLAGTHTGTQSWITIFIMLQWGKYSLMVILWINFPKININKILGFPGKYSPSSSITWILHYLPGLDIYIHFLTVDIEQCDGCGCDSLSIYNSDEMTSKNQIKRVCGHNVSLLCCWLF